MCWASRPTTFDIISLEVFRMTIVQLLEHKVRELDRTGLAAFRDWFRKYDSKLWDLQIERDIRSGKLEKLARQAISAHKRGKTREL